ncbi:hypothetical protein EK21DRAFT_91366 [Setomelanomma holmii]|uniref:Uncharacterized protein n=1 Tax=Setomelanomma holmii TaxID=210430 RepID=A0A9P4LJF9_9PLEO|nr:hypothetical protein EK21DRAFT_91366 [Setomelanomma holmii]
MARQITLLLLSVLLAFLAFAGVDAKSKADQIRVYQFTGDHCVGAPKGANIDLKRNECVNVDARSVKAMLDPKRTKWLTDVNNGGHRCFLVGSHSIDCPDNDKDVVLQEIPHDMADCVNGGPLPIRSVKFVCDLKIESGSSLFTSTATSTMVVTSWSVGNDNKVHPHTSTTTAVVTTTGAHPVTSTNTRTRSLGSRATDGESMEKDVWMYHPWSMTPICYHCYRKKEGNFVNFKCKSGPNVEANCPDRPIAVESEPITTTSTTVTTQTIHNSTISQPNSQLTTTTSVLTDGTWTFTQTTTNTPAAAELEARVSWHKSVHFENPFAADHAVCADAEWEKRGKPNTEIRLQKVKYKTNGNCENAESIDLPDPIVKTATSRTTRSATTTTTISSSAGHTTTHTGWPNHTTETYTVTQTPESTTTVTVTGGQAAERAGQAQDEEEGNTEPEAEEEAEDATRGVPLHGDL